MKTNIKISHNEKTKILSVTIFTAIIGLVAIAADHIDAPATQGKSADITDFYAVQGEDNINSKML